MLKCGRDKCWDQEAKEHCLGLRKKVFVGDRKVKPKLYFKTPFSILSSLRSEDYCRHFQCFNPLTSMCRYFIFFFYHTSIVFTSCLQSGYII